VSHDMTSVSRMSSKIALLHDRHVVFFGTPEEIMAQDDPYIRDFIGAL
jgi:osmoprotectant transport system ATP-binding protein